MSNKYYYNDAHAVFYISRNSSRALIYMGDEFLLELFRRHRDMKWKVQCSFKGSKENHKVYNFLQKDSWSSIDAAMCDIEVCYNDL